jgi:hypothetical protein
VWSIVQFFESNGLEISNFLNHAKALIFAIQIFRPRPFCMHTTLDIELPRRLSPDQPGLAYRFSLACLLFLWVVAILVPALLTVALFVPGHLGLTDLIQDLTRLLPVGAPMFTT